MHAGRVLSLTWKADESRMLVFCLTNCELDAKRGSSFFF